MKILEIRQSLGLTQKEFAEKFHFNVRTLQTWEQGTRKTPEYIIWLLRRIIELEELLGKERKGE